MTMDTLKPCPFCGDTPSERITSDDGLFIVCDKCNMARSKNNYAGDNRHKKAWNKRNNEGG